VRWRKWKLFLTASCMQSSKVVVLVALIRNNLVFLNLVLLLALRLTVRKSNLEKGFRKIKINKNYNNVFEVL
jgi:hypothetical protein